MGLVCIFLLRLQVVQCAFVGRGLFGGFFALFFRGMLDDCCSTGRFLY